MKYIILLLLFSTQLCFAIGGDGGGDRVGNGGDVLICNENGEDKYYVLDEYNAGFDLGEGDTNLSYSVQGSRILNKIKDHFPARYDAYMKIYKNFNASITYSNSPLPEIDDDMSREIEGCKKVQAAYFKKGVDGNYTYFLQKQIWNSLNQTQKTVLIFHEILYTEAVGLGIMTSVSVRAANRILFNPNHFDPIAFDDKFLLPLKYTGTFGQFTDQLQNAFSERIAMDLLERNWTLHYTDKTIVNKLKVLKNRFRSNYLIGIYVDDHLSRIQEVGQN